jgi:prefoldin subunit 5
MTTQPERREMTGISERDFGRLEAEVIGLKAQYARIERNQERMDEKIDLLVSAVTEAKGGWKMLLAVGAASATMATMVTKTIMWFKGG